MEKVTDYLMPFIMAGLMFIVVWQDGKRNERLKRLESTHTHKQVDSLQTLVNNQNVELINNRMELSKYVKVRETFREYNPLAAQEYENIYNSIETQWKTEAE
jgi:uncharacterized protein YlbG (UPF0298 family)